MGKRLIGNRKLVLEVIRENPGITLWRIRPKLKEKHRDWRVTGYVLIRHVLALHSVKLVRVQPKSAVKDLKRLLDEYRPVRKKLRSASFRVRGKILKQVLRKKKVWLKTAQSLMDRLARYTMGVELEEFLQSEFKLKKGSKRWLAYEKTIRKLSPELVRIEETGRGPVIFLRRNMLKEEPKEYDYTQLEEERRRIGDLTEETLRQIRCYPL